jgi:hypothetical protein
VSENPHFSQKLALSRFPCPQFAQTGTVRG